MAQQDVFMPVHYYRYVDVFFCVFYSLEYVKMSLSFLNNMHSNLKFTCEIGQQKLAFLDTLICYLLKMILVQLQMYIGSQLTPKLSLISMQFALGFGKVA